MSTAANPGLDSVYGRALLLLVPGLALAALNIALELADPTVALARSAVARAIIHGAVLGGLWLALGRAGFAAEQRRRIWLVVALVYTAWLALVWGLALEGVFRLAADGVPKLPIAIMLPLVVFLPMLLRSRRLGAALDAAPLSWLVGLQLYRVFGGVILAAWSRGDVASVFAFPAGLGDVLTGVLALPVAYLLYRDAPGARAAAVAWNLLGILDLVDAITIGFLSAPGPLQLIMPTPPNIGLGLYPLVLIPAFSVPSSLLLHALSLRQLRRRAGAVPSSPALAFAG